MAATSKRSRKSDTKRRRPTGSGGSGGGSKRSGEAVPPPDDPLSRHEEHDADRVLVDYDVATGTTASITVGDAQPTGSSPMLTMAQLRLDAMNATDAMPSHESSVAEVVAPIGEH